MPDSSDRSAWKPSSVPDPGERDAVGPQVAGRADLETGAGEAPGDPAAEFGDAQVEGVGADVEHAAGRTRVIDREQHRAGHVLDVDLRAPLLAAVHLDRPFAHRPGGEQVDHEIEAHPPGQAEDGGEAQDHRLVAVPARRAWMIASASRWVSAYSDTGVVAESSSSQLSPAAP